MRVTLVAMNWLDWTLVALLGTAAVRGFFRGFVVEIASLLAVILGIWVAARYNARVAGWIGLDTHHEVISFIITFIAILILVHLLAKGEAVRGISRERTADHQPGLRQRVGRGQLVDARGDLEVAVDDLVNEVKFIAAAADVAARRFHCEHTPDLCRSAGRRRFPDIPRLPRS